MWPSTTKRYVPFTTWEAAPAGKGSKASRLARHRHCCWPARVVSTLWKPLGSERNVCTSPDWSAAVFQVLPSRRCTTTFGLSTAFDPPTHENVAELKRVTGAGCDTAA